MKNRRYYKKKPLSDKVTEKINITAGLSSCAGPLTKGVCKSARKKKIH